MSNVTLIGSQDSSIKSFVIDSRKIRKASVFFALDGARHRGVDFAGEAVRKGASCIVAEKKHAEILSPVKGKISIVLVDDMMTALREAATWYKSLFQVITVAVTGSNGKTTTKELIAMLLRLKYKVHSTEKNFNNEIGVPLTVFGLEKKHQVFVVELGINHPGEMDRLASIVKPDYAVITNVGASHLEFMGSVETVAKEKARLLAHTSGKAFLNIDTGHLDLFASVPLRKVFVNRTDKETSYHFETIRSLGLRGYEFVFCGTKGSTRLYGDQNMDNLIMAIAVASELGVTCRKIVKACSKLKSVGSRASVYGKKGLDIIDESYNSNYSSLSRSIEFLGRLEGYTCKSVVIGEMKELGDTSDDFHGRVGRDLSFVDVLRIYIVGEATKKIAENYAGKGIVEYFPTVNEAEKAIATDLEICGGKTVVLVKGSRSNRLDRLVENLVKRLKLRVGPHAF